MSSCSYVFNSQSIHVLLNFFFSSRRRHTRWPRDWSSDVCSSDLNLTVITEARVQRLLLDGKTVLGAEYLHQGKLQTVHAGETLLSGGAINSPQVLLLSGIGPKAELERHGIPQQHDLPGVGENLQ